MSRKPDRKGKRTLRLENALQEKEMGNECFKLGNYKLAIEHYGKAIEHDPKESIYFINRAMAYLKLQEWEKAEKDCNSGLILDKHNTKAFWRRAIARREMGKLEEAKKDLEDALSLQPDDKATTSELDKVLEAIKMQEEKSNQKLLSETNKSNEYILNKRRLSIEIVEFDDEDDKIIELAEKKSKETIIRNKDHSLIGNGNNDSATTTITNVVDIKSLKIPKNIYEFEIDWKKYEQNIENLYLYFKNIPPSSYPKIFSDFFEIDYLLKIIIILKKFYLIHDNVDCVYEVLYNLSCVSRFKMVLTFLKNEEKQETMKDLFDSLFKSIDNSSNQQKFTMDDVMKLAKVYDVHIN